MHFEKPDFIETVVGYAASANEILRSVGAVLLLKHLEQPYLVELFVIDELEQFWRGVEPVGQTDQKRQSGNFRS
eukprot:9472167-Pyramimonas_sp.AAC.1